MNLHQTSGRRTATEPTGTPRTPGATLPTERLPFTVRLVRSEADLYKAVRIRHSAYARHVPAFAETLRTPEAFDTMDGAAVLLAESKLDGAPLGTMRIQTNIYAPLPLEQSVTLPEHLRHATLAEATRLGITEESQGRAVKTVLFKAFFLYCRQRQIDWMVITARAPIDRQYERLMFKDVDPSRGYIPLPHVGNLPHRILCFEVANAEQRWSGGRHPLFDFVFGTDHVDIDLGEPPQRRPAIGAAIPARMPHMAM